MAEDRTETDQFVMKNVEALQLLELIPPFTMAELKKAYRQAQMIWHPDRFPANDELHAKALARSKLINEAFSEISRALKADYDFKATAPRQAATYRKVASQEPPKSAADFNRRGVGYQSKGRTNKAIADFTEAIRLDPKGNVSILQGELRFGGPHPCEEGWKHKHAVATLAAIHAKLGNFDKATQVQKRLLELPDLTEDERVEGIRCLALYAAQTMGETS